MPLLAVLQERHKTRMEKLIKASFLLDYTLRNIKLASAVDGVAPSTQLMAVDDQPPAAAVAAAPDGGTAQRFRRAEIDGPARAVAADAAMETATEFEPPVAEDDDDEPEEEEVEEAREQRENIRGAAEFQNRTRRNKASASSESPKPSPAAAKKNQRKTPKKRPAGGQQPGEAAASEPRRSTRPRR